MVKIVDIKSKNKKETTSGAVVNTVLISYLEIQLEQAKQGLLYSGVFIGETNHGLNDIVVLDKDRTNIYMAIGALQIVQTELTNGLLQSRGVSYEIE